jgi:hypothetical protein
MAQPAYLTDQQVLGQTPETADLSRQRRIAELLMTQGMEQPQGQMISGHYVAPSWTQQIAPLAKAAIGTGLSQSLDEKQLKLAEALRGEKTTENKAISDAINKKDWTLASELIANSKTGAGKEYMPLIAKYLVPEQRKPQVVAPGGALVDESGKLIYQAPYKPMAGESMGGIDGEGRFNKKGDFITPTGTPIFKSEVIKDREIVRTADLLRKGLDKISDEDIKKSDTILGDVTQVNPNKSFLAKKVGFEDAVTAQTKINSSSVMQLLQNLPPGPASDKDIQMARSTFPGYGSEKALKEWIVNTKANLQDKINMTNQKYGTENWYGAQSISSDSVGGGDLAAAAAAERKRRKESK